MLRRALLLALVAVALVSAGCQSPPPGPQVAADPAAEAAAALARGDYAQAVEQYRTALKTDPDRLPLRYGLAIAASHLGLRDEAIREFRWVLVHAASGSGEAETARRWLAAAGVLPVAMRPAEPASEASQRGAGEASLEGIALRDDNGQVKPAQRIPLLLIGLPDTPAEEARFRQRTDEQGRFRFPGVVPGTYMLTDAIAGTPGWRLRVELQQGQTVVLDLTEANSAKFRNDFPDRN